MLLLLLLLLLCAERRTDLRIKSFGGHDGPNLQNLFCRNTNDVKLPRDFEIPSDVMPTKLHF